MSEPGVFTSNSPDVVNVWYLYPSPGVVSVPHGYGHGRREGVGWKHAASLPGASVNDITDPAVRDAVTGNAAFNNVAVRIEAA